MKHKITATLALAASAIGNAAIAQQDTEKPWSYGDMMWGGGFGIGGGIMMVLFWGAIIVLIVVAVRALSNSGPSTREPDAMDVLKQRFARGEIDEDEFERRKKTLDRV